MFQIELVLSYNVFGQFDRKLILKYPLKIYQKSQRTLIRFLKNNKAFSSPVS